LRTKFVSFYVLAAALLAPLSVAQAQLSSRGGPITYSANNLEYQDQNRLMILTGNVDLTQGCARMQADKLTLYFKPSPTGAAPASLGSGDIDHIIAEGEVHFVRPDIDQRARGDRADYQSSTDAVTLTGNVVLTNADGVLRGESLVLQVGAGRTTLTPASKPGERVRGVLNPKQVKPVPAPSATPAC
jgi:lipopolysaccharide export system protein LptA